MGFWDIIHECYKAFGEWTTVMVFIVTFAIVISIFAIFALAFGTKKCPHCLGLIPKQARVCKHCGRDQ
jgi:hypothetical protein